MPSRPALRHAFRPVAALFLGTLSLGGCNAGHESYQFPSTTHTPQTVTLVNTRTGERLWSQEVPAGSQLNIAFVRSPGVAEEQHYDEMRWSITSLGRSPGSVLSTTPTSRSSMMRVPPPSERRLEVVVRDGPEDRPSAVGAVTPPAQPTTGAPSQAPTIVPPDPKQPAPK